MPRRPGRSRAPCAVAGSGRPEIPPATPAAQRLCAGPDPAGLHSLGARAGPDSVPAVLSGRPYSLCPRARRTRPRPGPGRPHGPARARARHGPGPGRLDSLSRAADAAAARRATEAKFRAGAVRRCAPGRRRRDGRGGFCRALRFRRTFNRRPAGGGNGAGLETRPRLRRRRPATRRRAPAGRGRRRRGKGVRFHEGEGGLGAWGREQDRRWRTAAAWRNRPRRASCVWLEGCSLAAAAGQIQCHALSTCDQSSGSTKKPAASVASRALDRSQQPGLMLLVIRTHPREKCISRELSI